MALTKTEAAKLSNDLLLRGVIDTIVKESSVLTVLPFSSVVGNSLTYNRESTNPVAAFYDVGDTWTEATPTFTQVQATLKILGGDADVDNFLEQTYADTNDLQAEVIAKLLPDVKIAFFAHWVDAIGKSLGVHVTLHDFRRMAASPKGVV